MGIDLRGYEEYVELLYNDRMDITSTVESVDEDGATVNGYPQEPQQKDVPCKVSLPSKDKVSDSETFEAVSLNPIIFCSPRIKVRAGDRIAVRKCHPDGTVYESFRGLLAETGKPNVFVTHQEFELKLEGDA